MKANKQENIILIFILFIAFLLRFLNISNAEFGYDELSAIFRAQNAPDWSTHISKGVMPDGHPAGLQTFIWLWIKTFPTQLLALKWIMGICSVISVFFIYKIGKNTLNVYAGFSAAILLSILFIPVDWSLQVRPYAPGLMAVLLTVWMFTEIVFNLQTSKKYWFFLILGLILAFYIHYFAALTAVVAAIAFFFLSSKTQKVHIFYASVIAAIGFLPHVSITLYQFSQKGLNWLGKPSSTFFSQHIKDIFSGSLAFLCIAMILALTGLISAYKNKILSRIIVERIFLFWAIFIVPLIIGYIYSITRSPVLQNQVLLFSMTGFILCIAIFMGLVPFALQKFQFLLLLLLGISILTVQKKYFSEANENAYKQELKYCNAYSNRLGIDSVYVWMDGANDILEYYIQKYYQKGISYNRVNHYDPERIFNLILKNRDTKKYIAMGLQSGTDANFRTQLEVYFGKPLHAVSFNGGEFLLFNTQRLNPVPFITLSNSKDAKLEFSKTDVTWTDFVVIRTKSTGISGEIQTAIMNKKEQIDWRGSKLKMWNFVPWENEYSENFHVIKLADIPSWTPQCTLQVHILADSIQNNMFVPEFKGIDYLIVKGNPYIYGINSNTSY